MFPPEVAIARHLCKNVSDVSGAVGHVCQDRENKYSLGPIQRDFRSRARIILEEIAKNDRGQGRVVNEATRLPVADRVGCVVFQRL